MKWKSIEGLPYEVSHTGIVRRYKKENHIAQYVSGYNGYCYVQLFKHNQRYVKAVHRLVAIAFLKSHPDFPIVTHKDLDRTHNHVSNLLWIDYNGKPYSPDKPLKANYAIDALPMVEEEIKELERLDELVALYENPRTLEND